jgi:glycogen phosphorylase
VQVPIACSFALEGGRLRFVRDRPTYLLGVPYDRPIVGFGGKTINTLRLWGAASPDYFNFGEFNTGDFVGALVDRMAAKR